MIIGYTEKKRSILEAWQRKIHEDILQFVQDNDGMAAMRLLAVYNGSIAKFGPVLFCTALFRVPLRLYVLSFAFHLWFLFPLFHFLPVCWVCDLTVNYHWSTNKTILQTFRGYCIFHFDQTHRIVISAGRHLLLRRELRQ